MLNFSQDFACGSISGVASCFSGYFLDTLKVRMQVNPGAKMWPTFRAIINNEGFKSLYKGIYYPLMTVPLVNAIIFSSYQMYKTIRGKQNLSFIDGLENGAFVGVVLAFVATPIELIKCNMQTDKQSKFRSSKECLREILKNEGIRGMFKGLSATALREIPSFAGQFATYQFLKRYFVGNDRTHMQLSESLIVGPIAAINSQLVSYPQDIIKTKIQISPTGTYKSHSKIWDGGFIDCANSIYRAQGLRGFFFGIKPCLIRAIVGDGFGIMVYQTSQKTFTKLRKF